MGQCLSLNAHTLIQLSSSHIKNFSTPLSDSSLHVFDHTMCLNSIAAVAGLCAPSLVFSPAHIRSPRSAFISHTAHLLLEREIILPLHPRLLSTPLSLARALSSCGHWPSAIKGTMVTHGARCSYTFFRAHVKICVFSWPARIDELFFPAARRHTHTDLVLLAEIVPILVNF